MLGGPSVADGDEHHTDRGCAVRVDWAKRGSVMAGLLGTLAAPLGWGTAARAAGDAPPTPYVRPAPAKLSLPSTPGDHKLKFTTTIAGRRVTMSYLLHLPPAYTAGGPPRPMLVFFHGNGHAGTDLGAIYSEGPMGLFRPDDSSNPVLAGTWPFVCLSPQCPPRGEAWSDDFIYRASVELVAAVVHSGRIDADRVYAAGLSGGGLGTWCVAEAGPDLFAAIAPLSAMEWQPEVAGDRLRFVAVWGVAGLDDQARFVDGTRAMEHALASGPVADRFTYFAHEGHTIFNDVFEGPQLYEWLLAHRRPDADARARLVGRPPPVVPTAPGHYLLTYDTIVGDQPVQMDYVLYIPRPPADRPGPARHPALLFLSERDTIGPDYHGICMHGPDLALERDPALAARFPFVVISPRLPVKCRWTDRAMARALAGLLDHVGAIVPVDPTRLAVGGVDSGAFAAWWLADALPHRFSALLWVTTQPDMGPPGDNGRLVQDLPGRAFLPADVAARVSRQFAAQLARTHRDWATLSLPPGATPAANLPAYSDPATLDWLAHQRRAPG